MHRNQNDMSFYADALKHVLEDGLGTIIADVAEIQIYLEQVLPEPEKEAFVEILGDLKVIRGQIVRPSVEPVALISMCYKGHDSVARLVQLIVADIQRNSDADKIYDVLSSKVAGDYRQSRGQLVAARHGEALKHLQARGAEAAAAAAE
jgi:hypothetical protein